MKKLILLILGLAALPVWADTRDQLIYGNSPENNFEDDSKPWAEVQAQLPAYPKQENLVRFDVSAATDNTYSIDTASISIGQDEVVRYTVVIDSPRGARTVNFEGIRCDPTEFKIYAFGHADNTWSKNRYAKWEGYKLRSLLSYHKALFEDHFCPNGLRVRTAKDAIRDLKRTQPR
jgi:hypothetical protein